MHLIGQLCDVLSYIRQVYNDITINLATVFKHLAFLVFDKKKINVRNHNNNNNKRIFFIEFTNKALYVFLFLARR